MIQQKALGIEACSMFFFDLFHRPLIASGVTLVVLFDSIESTGQGYQG
jgi:hypothetical protein